MIRFSVLELRFLQDRHGTGGSLDLFSMTAQQAVVELGNPTLKARADALLFDLGREPARQETQRRRRRVDRAAIDVGGNWGRQPST
ncbi:cupin domain-containing protein [Methylobacterium radiotolerans]|uniref:hypothetical protein n=1 Tax=Methylobacterium radiotolerans TaxID=31998 RepID=UPI0038D079B7